MRPIQSCVAASALASCIPALAQQAQTELFAPDISAPVTVAFAPGDTSRVFVLGRFGKITVHDPATGAQRPQPFIDLLPLVCCYNNSNMVGLAFDPNYATNGYFYVHYQGIPTESVVARYHVTANPDIADPNSGTIIMKTPRLAFGHIGGSIEFSPIDGFLYVPTGDGGNGLVADPNNDSQSLSSPFGKVMRIDTSGDDFPADPDRNYKIPATNPFINTPGALPEIWAYGHRNPYQSTFDRTTGEFYVADVGQDSREEVDLQPPTSTGGLNYGWRCREGDMCSGFGGCDCNAPDFVEPMFTYNHSAGCSISGGRVYRGSAIPDLVGWYVFSDYCSGFLRAIRRVNGVTEFRDLTTQLAPPDPFQGVTSISDDAQGELYITDIVGILGGRVFKIVPIVLCPADLDDGSATGTRDNAVDVNDLLYFLVRFEAGDVAIDLDNGSGTGTHDSAVDINDLLYFLVRFEAGC